MRNLLSHFLLFNAKFTEDKREICYQFIFLNNVFFFAGIVSLILTVFYQPVWTSAIFSLNDYLLAMTAFLLLQFWHIPAWVVVCFVQYRQDWGGIKPDK
nr:hypothetical protein [Legionella pneumophila]